jgi:hypothetical protein
MKSGNKPFIVERTMTSETEDFGIDPSVIPALFDNIYKNKVRTLTQEYMSNARDANREVNASRPIEVTLPSPFVATLIIRDFGPGIDPDRMSKVFIQIGRSTKTQTNTQTGGFGVGCKSYFAYGETFHINTYIQGTKRSYTCWKDGDKQLHIDFHRQLECPTDEPNGTEITLPVLVKDIEEFNRAVFRSTYFWKESERAIVRGLNSSHPYHEKNHQISVIEFCSGDVKFPTFISNRIGKPDTFCLIDGIPYPLNEGIREKVPEIKELEQLCAPNTCLIIHLNNGTVRVAISREDIDNSSQTINALREIFSHPKSKSRY